jgi:hypothetical protein
MNSPSHEETAQVLKFGLTKEALDKAVAYFDSQITEDIIKAILDEHKLKYPKFNAERLLDWVREEPHRPTLLVWLGAGWCSKVLHGKAFESISTQTFANRKSRFEKQQAIRETTREWLDKCNAVLATSPGQSTTDFISSIQGSIKLDPLRYPTEKQQYWINEHYRQRVVEGRRWAEPQVLSPPSASAVAVARKVLDEEPMIGS